MNDVLLTPDDVRNATFRVRWMFGGYDTDDVDEFLDEVTHTLEVQATLLEDKYGPED